MSKIRVSIQGLPGSFHDDAAKKHFGVDTELIYRAEFSQVFDDLKKNKADSAVVAYENARYGPIYEVDDLMKRHKPEIVSEVKIDVSFCLLGVKGSKPENVSEVYSQKPALIQCQNFLQDELPGARPVEHYDTAGAAADVSKWNQPAKAALASKSCADIYELKILAEKVEDAPGHNETKFYVLAIS